LELNTQVHPSVTGGTGHISIYPVQGPRVLFACGGYINGLFYCLPNPPIVVWGTSGRISTSVPGVAKCALSVSYCKFVGSSNSSSSSVRLLPTSVVPNTPTISTTTTTNTTTVLLLPYYYYLLPLP